MVKGGFRSRLNPAYRARGQEAGARDGTLLRRTEGLSARMVGVEAGASGSCRPLKKGKPSRESGSRARRIVRGSRRSEGHRAYPGRGEAYRHRMGACPSAATTAKRPGRQAAKRSPPGARRYPWSPRPVPPGERCPWSTETGRRLTEGGGRERSAACGNASAKRRDTNSCPDRRPKNVN